MMLLGHDEFVHRSWRVQTSMFHCLILTARACLACIIFWGGECLQVFCKHPSQPNNYKCEAGVEYFDVSVNFAIKILKLIGAMLYTLESANKDVDLTVLVDEVCARARDA